MTDRTKSKLKALALIIAIIVAIGAAIEFNKEKLAEINESDTTFAEEITQEGEIIEGDIAQSLVIIGDEYSETTEKKCQYIGVDYEVGKGFIFKTDDTKLPAVSLNDLFSSLLQMKKTAEQQDMINKLGLQVGQQPTE